MMRWKMMKKITVSNELFVEFISKCTLNGEIPQLLMKQTVKGYEVSVMSENVISCEGILFKKNFITFEDIGNITIKDTKKFISMLKGINGNIVIEKKENKIIIHGEKTDIEYVLCSEEFIENTLSEHIGIEFDDGFKINKEFFLTVKTKANLFDVSSVTFEVNKNIIRGIVEETDKYIIKEEVPYKDCSSSYGSWLFKLSDFLEDKVVMSFDTNYPVKIMSKNTNFELNFFIAPFVKTEESVGETEKDEDNEQDKEKS